MSHSNLESPNQTCDHQGIHSNFKDAAFQRRKYAAAFADMRIKGVSLQPG